MTCLTDNQLAVFGEIVLGNLEVEGGRSLPYSAGDIVVRTVARAEPATIVTGLADGDTTEMGADTLISHVSIDQLGHRSGGSEQKVKDASCIVKRTKHDKPLRGLHTVGIVFGVSEGANVDLVRGVDLLLGSVSDEDGLSSPLDDNLGSLSAWRWVIV